MSVKKSLISLWKNKSKKGTTYFTGHDANGVKLTGFYNIKVENSNAPAIRIYDSSDLNTPVLVMWLNTSKTGIKYLTGKYHNVRVVGFINDKPKSDKAPYLNIYESDAPKKSEQEKTPSDVNTGDLPF